MRSVLPCFGFANLVGREALTCWGSYGSHARLRDTSRFAAAVFLAMSGIVRFIGKPLLEMIGDPVVRLPLAFKA